MKIRSKRQICRWAGLILSIAMVVLQVVLPAYADNAPCAEGEHDWVLDVYDEPTCEENGIAAYYCSKCGTWERELLPATGHSWTGWQEYPVYDQYGNVMQQDCTKGLSQYRICSVCGATDYRIKEPWEHDFYPWETIQAGTCLQEGLQSRTCKDCGIVEQRSAGYGYHQYGEWVEVQPATCVEQGIWYHDCSLCGYREYYYEDKIPHTFGDWSVLTEATDFSAGTRKRICSVCGFEETGSFYPDGTVFYGDYSMAVYELQVALNEAGYDCGEADGAFGNNTQRAVTECEKAYNLPEDGIGWPGIRKLLAGEDVNGDTTGRRPADRHDPDNAGANPREERSNPTDNSSENNTNQASLKLIAEVNKTYEPEGRDFYYANEAVYIWVNIWANGEKSVFDIYFFEEPGGEKITYDPKVYADFLAGTFWKKALLERFYIDTFLYRHVITPEEAEAGNYVFKVYALGQDSSGQDVKSNTEEIEIKTSGVYYPPNRTAEEPPADPSIEIRESTQAGSRMEGQHSDYFYYPPGAEVRYKIIVKNETEYPFYDIEIGYDMQPSNIRAARLPGQEEEKTYELDEGDTHIRFDLLEPGETRAFYVCCEVPSETGEKGIMKHEARLSFTNQDGFRKTIFSDPCEVPVGSTPEPGSEE